MNTVYLWGNNYIPKTILVMHVVNEMKQRGLLWLAFYSGWNSSSSRARQPAVHKTYQLLTLWCFYPERNPSWKTIILFSHQLQPVFCSVPSVNSLAGLCGDRLLCSLIQTRGQKPPVPHFQTNTRRLFRTNSLPVRNRKKVPIQSDSLCSWTGGETTSLWTIIERGLDFLPHGKLFNIT